MLEWAGMQVGRLLKGYWRGRWGACSGPGLRCLTRQLDLALLLLLRTFPHSYMPHVLPLCATVDSATP